MSVYVYDRRVSMLRVYFDRTSGPPDELRPDWASPLAGRCDDGSAPERSFRDYPNPATPEQELEKETAKMRRG